MLLVLDIGNSNIVAGVYDGAKLKASWRMATQRASTADEQTLWLGDFLKSKRLKPRSIRHSILSSVVPPLVPVYEVALQRLFGSKPLVVSTALDLGIRVSVLSPEEVGADRLVNSVAGYHRFGGPLLIVDSGTATTVDVVSAGGEYLGGAILPGVGISLDALVSRSAKLPRIDLAKPRKAIGNSTLEAMRSGIYYGTLGQIKELIARLGAELGGRPKVIATGGWANWFPAKELGISEVLPDLTLEGLRLIHERCARPARPAKRKPARRR
jgi:type III pantothenate kinase